MRHAPEEDLMKALLARVSPGRDLYASLICLAVAAVGGCASYATPGRAADLRAFGVSKDQQTDASVVQAIDKRPLATLPTSIAIVRVQEPGYHSETAQGWGNGAYSIVTTRDIEKMDEKMADLAKLPLISALAPVNRLLLPQQLNSDLELRQAAAALHCDMVLIYTLDTTFNVEDAAAPLSVITLGLSPNQMAHVVCTASAVLMDTRDGYIYGVAEATERQNQLASAWTSEAAVDQTRRRTESKAFEKLVGDLQTTWMGVVKQMGTAEHAALLELQ
jgi:hypothetical protein